MVRGKKSERRSDTGNGDFLWRRGGIVNQNSAGDKSNSTFQGFGPGRNTVSHLRRSSNYDRPGHTRPTLRGEEKGQIRNKTKRSTKFVIRSSGLSRVSENVVHRMVSWLYKKGLRASET